LDRCALFVDANYALSGGAFAVHGTRNRDSVSWDYAGLLKLLGGLARDRTGLPMLRCYWYDCAPGGERTADHDAIADQPGVKLRLSKVRPSRKEGVEAEIRRDLTALARNRAVSDVVIVSGEEDLGAAVAEVQDLGIRAVLLHVTADGDDAVSRGLRQECDDTIEVSAAHLRPYVELIPGAEPAVSEAPRSPAHAHRGPAESFRGAADSSREPLPGYPGSAQPPREPVSAFPGQAQLPREPVSAFPGQAQLPREPVSAFPGLAQLPREPVSAFPGQAQPPREPAASYPGPAESFRDQAAGFGMPSAASRGRSAGGSGQGSGPHHSIPPAEASFYQPPTASDYQQAGLPHPTGAGASHGQGGFSPPPLPSGGPGQNGVHPHSQIAPGAPSTNGLSANGTGGRAAPPAGLNGMPMGAADSKGVPPQVGGLPTGGPAPAQPGMPPGSMLPAPLQSGLPLPGHAAQDQMPTGHVPTGHSGPHQAPGSGLPQGMHQNGLAPMDAQRPGLSQRQLPPANGMPYSQDRSGQYGQLPPAQLPPAQYSPQQQGMPSYPPAPYGSPQPPAVPQPAISVGDAVQSAHAEGYAFGEAVARDAPALWLEAVLARKPRMPSDLEARLLQGSALPIDSLLHDEVRHALRRGFWDALERSRR
jgi:uncharacterized LabA/DUF88 family protein